MYASTIPAPKTTDLKQSWGPVAELLYPPDGVFRPEGRGYYDPRLPNLGAELGYDYPDHRGQWWHVDPSGGPCSLMQEAFRVAGVQEQATSLRVYGDEDNEHTVIIDMNCCRVTFARNGQTILSAAVSPSPQGGVDPDVIRKSGVVCEARDLRHNPFSPDRPVAYLRKMRLHDRIFWRIVPCDGSARSDHDTRESAIAAARELA